MKFLSLTIQNYKVIKDKTFNFEDITALIGKNGTGKTTVLNVLASFLNREKIEKISKDFYIELVVEHGWEPDELSDIKHTTKNSKYKGKIVVTENTVIFSYDNSKYRLKNMYLFKEAKILSYLTHDHTLAHIFTGAKNSLRYLQRLDLYSPKLTIKKLHSYITDTVFLDTNTASAPETIAFIVKDLNKYLEVFNFKEEIKYTKLKGLTFGEHNLTIGELSSGMQLIITLLLFLYTDDNHDSIVLIDEPESSLHPAWQMLLPKFLAQFEGNTQVITATHSMPVVYMLKDEQIQSTSEQGAIIKEGFNLEETAVNLFDLPFTTTTKQIELENLIESIEHDILQESNAVELLDDFAKTLSENSALALEVDIAKFKYNGWKES